jgi:hypothetical protein
MPHQDKGELRVAKLWQAVRVELSAPAVFIMYITIYTAALCCAVVSWLCRAGVYSVGPADQKQLLSCAELANRRHEELTEQLQQQAGYDMEQ